MAPASDMATIEQRVELLICCEHTATSSFFLCYGLSKPHSPLEAPQRFFNMFDADQIPLPPDFAPPADRA